MNRLAFSLPNPIDTTALERLRRAAGPGPVLVACHLNPDPDALSAGLGLATLLQEAWQIPARLVFSGVIGRAENRAVHRLLTPQWEYVETFPDLTSFSAVALIDSQPGAGNNNLPEGLIPQIVIDHHLPIRPESERVRYADIRADIGATVTMVYQYLSAAQVALDPTLATAMFYGLRSDTNGLARGATPVDGIVYALLHTVFDPSLMNQVELSGLSQRYFTAFDQGLHHAQISGRVLTAYLGNIHRPDLPAEMADLLIRLEEVHTVLCLGVYDHTLYFSLRTGNLEGNAGLLVQRLIPDGGKAGGHSTIAGGQVPLNGHAVEQLVDDIRTKFLRLMHEADQARPLLILDS